jgi:hypothetical protein
LIPLVTNYVIRVTRKKTKKVTGLKELKATYRVAEVKKLEEIAAEIGELADLVGKLRYRYATLV